MLEHKRKEERLSTQTLSLPDRAGQDAQWRELHEFVERAGLLKKQYPYYAGKILITLCMLGVSVWLLAATDYFWPQMANALFLAFVLPQIAIMAHAAGHGQMFCSPRKNNFISLLAGFLVGLSREWWDEKHNGRHHGNPNTPGLDPDVTGSILSFTTEQAMGTREVGKVVAKYQAFLIVPLLFFEAVSIRLDSVQYILCSSKRKQPMEYPVIELISILGHLIGYPLLLVFLLDPWWYTIPFALIHQGFMGLYLGTLFAPNHKGMLMLDKERSDVGFLWRQVPTSRNIKNPRFLDWFFDAWFGGLNSQIEHHLFPAMPECNLRKARGKVRSFCAEHGIPYCETGILQACKEIFRYLHRVGAPLRVPRSSAPS